MINDFPTICPWCGYQHDSHAAVGKEDSTPAPGGVGICISCGEPGIFTSFLGGPLTLRRPSPEERTVLMADPTVVEVLFAHRRMMEANPLADRG